MSASTSTSASSTIKLPTANNKYLDTRLGNKLGTDLSLHDGVLIGFLADNHYIRAGDKKEEKEEKEEKTDLEKEIEKMGRYSFVLEEKNILYYNDYIKKVAKTVPVSVLEKVTDLRSSEYEVEGEMVDQVVAFLPVSFRLYNSNCRSYRLTLEHLVKVFSDMDYMSMKTPLGVFQVDQAIENLFILEKEFWNTINMKRHEMDLKADAPEQAKACLTWLMARRIKNKTYKHVRDFDQIIKNIDDTEFLDSQDPWYSAGIKPEDTFEKDSNFQQWKNSLGISHLPVEDYQKYLTYEETSVLFRCLELYPEYFLKLCGLFLSSYQLCHLIMFGGELDGKNWIIEKFVKMMSSVKYKNFWDTTFDSYYRSDGSSSTWNSDLKNMVSHAGQRIFRLMSAVLYFEERLLAGKITQEHRCLVPISFSSSLPHITMMKDPSRPRGNYDLNYSRRLAFWYQTCANFYYPLNLTTKINYHAPSDYKNTDTKICDQNEFNLRFDMISGGMLEGLDWKGLNVYLTGAGAEMCYYRNGYFPFEFLLSEHPDNPYLGSDLDLGVWINPKELNLELVEGDDGTPIYNQESVRLELRTRAEAILAVVKQNYGLKDLELIARNTRWIIKHPDLPRELDIFSFLDQPGALIYNYHMATCRVVAQPCSQGEVRMLSSACLSAMMGTCIDRRWFTSKKSIHNRILKHFKRGIGLMMNPHETKVIIQYIYNYQKQHPQEHTILNNLSTSLEVDGQIPASFWKSISHFFLNGGFQRIDLFMNCFDFHNQVRRSRHHAELASLLDIRFK
jgi:hypothetical protein